MLLEGEYTTLSMIVCDSVTTQAHKGSVIMMQCSPKTDRIITASHGVYVCVLITLFYCTYSCTDNIIQAIEILSTH